MFFLGDANFSGGGIYCLAAPGTTVETIAASPSFATVGQPAIPSEDHLGPRGIFSKIFFFSDTVQ